MTDDTRKMNDAATRPLRLTEHLAIFWRHRRVGHPKVHDLRVDFDKIIRANHWNLATNFDELVERYANLY